MFPGGHFYINSSRAICSDCARKLELTIFTTIHFKEECSMSYKVYLYNIPKVSEDGKQAIPVPDSQVKEFDGVDDAKIFAAERKNSFDHAVLMQEDNEGQKMVVRYVDGL
jgi:hypothetical protein